MRRRHERHALGLLAVARRLTCDGWSGSLLDDLDAELLELGYFDAATRRARVLARRIGQ